MDEPFYCLTLCMGQYKQDVYGYRGVLLDVLGKFEAREWDEGEKIRIVGICNTADRAERIVVVRLDRIDSMDLFLL